MNIFVVETCVIKLEKRKQFKSLMQRVLKYKKENPELFKEVRSFRLFSQMFGGVVGGYVSMWEFDNMADLERCWAREEKDEGFMRLHNEVLQLIEPTTFSISVWNSVGYAEGLL